MDQTRFDAISRMIVQSPTRRGALLTLAGLLAGSAVELFETPVTEAKRASNKPCPPCRKKKDGKCNKAKKPDGTPCGTDKICQSGKCRLDPSL